VVLSQSAQTGFLKPKLLFDHTKWVLNLGPDVSLSRLNQIQQASIRGLG
jgi:hypothetical protein